ncbi:neuropeptides B/W receptor type 2-like [Mytilus californianus]|uniref:neuropeptides B/W receptor type 2-like n=1 Tax=Mytilus californianus TaxID=6549 RepID=UPI00224530F4|nr:neuropeptides B/W receptor type 2-like [Mytilus californianus]XP_052106038.1 neuropeptides B/W receptor type 2-like [Mytilus californianus]XP_052106040.1 neuropeptides B/W receptor type 2-like [Mytilus californianus]XP_052106041.1 neuropeptides B/W receptor type 2-like [Mytilus californianus]XP_052106042.1 neuropeptides B/W receptor type 2-like [Mytilus californianus]
MNFDMNSSLEINSTITADEEGTCRISNWLIVKAENDKQPLISVICAIAVLLLTGMIGNGLVIYVYSRKPKTTTNRIFILALAILDFLSCTVVIPFEIYDLGHTFTFTRTILCKLARFSEFMLILGAGFTLVAISIDRYVHLCRYKSRLLLTASRAKKVCGFCVFLGLLFAVPLVKFAGLEKIPLNVNNTNVTACGCTTFENPNAKSGKIYTYLLMTTFLSALITMLVSYCFIGATLYGRRQGKTRNGLTFITNTEETKRLHKTKAFPEMRKKESFAIGKSAFSLNGSTFVFLTVTVVFVLGFVPHLGVRVLRFLHLAFNEDTSMDLLYNFLVRSYLINSVSNPFIYSIIHKRFRDELLKTVKSIICCKKKSPLSRSQRSRTNSTNNETSFT